MGGGNACQHSPKINTSFTEIVATYQMYLWRFAIEHMFRFLKTVPGLERKRIHRSSEYRPKDVVVRLCYWQLLLMRDEIENPRLAWFPAKTSSGE
jgi:hypothetical protein